MQKPRRDFLRTISSAAALPVVVPLLKSDARTDVEEDLSSLGRETSSDVRSHFPLLGNSMKGQPFVYLDSAATTQRPHEVLDALNNFYLHENANPSVSLHALARRSAALYGEARATVARFLNAHGPDEIVWTRGTTEAINLVASSWGGANIGRGDEIVITVSDHYSSLVPWQLAARRSGATLRIWDVSDDGCLRLDQLDTLLSKRTKIVTFPHVSNVLGAVNPAKEICERAHRAGAVVLVDAAQSVPHFPVDVREIGCDFLALSGHKMCGPMGIGVLWGRRDILDAMPPFQAGSNMVHEVDLESAPAHFAEGGLKFEAGTPNVPGAAGLGAAVRFLESFGRKELWTREQELTEYALSRLGKIKGVRILGPTNASERISVFSFVAESNKALDIAASLDRRGVAVRAGDLASLPALKRFGVTSAVRASCYIYTSAEDIDQLIAGLQEPGSC
jgi:cysteine desulfurase / selenocysteine lyase